MPQQPLGAGVQVLSMCFFDDSSSNGRVISYLLARLSPRQDDRVALIFREEGMRRQSSADSQQSVT
jgi:hypothetical protein